LHHAPNNLLGGLKMNVPIARELNGCELRFDPYYFRHAVEPRVSSFFYLRVSRKRSAHVALAFFTIFRCRLCGQFLQPFSQPFKLPVCAELVQAVNADLNRFSVAVGDTVDLFGATHVY
jgi:hypothetical protein